MLKSCSRAYLGQAALEVKCPDLRFAARRPKAAPRLHRLESASSNGHIQTMTILGRHKLYLVVSGSLLTRP